MDTGSYEYLSLAKKHDNFLSPGFEVYVDGKKLAANIAYVSQAEVEINGEGFSGGCSFSIEGQYDFKTHKWINDMQDRIEAGKQVSIKGGYGSSKDYTELFYGYIDDYTIDFQEDGAPKIDVCGLDGLGYLMNMREPYYGGEKTAKKVVEEILGKSVSADFAKSVKVGKLETFKAPVLKEQIDDWKFLRLMAQRCGASMFVVDGEMIFDTLVTNSSPIITLTLGKSLFYFRKRVSLAHQVGKVEVWGRDVNQKAIQGSADSVSVGSGKSAVDLAPGLANAVLRENNEFVRTEDECKKLAQHRMNTIAMGLVTGSGACTGIPELIPGRYIKIDGGDEKSNGSYFITKVRHKFSANGFITEFEVKGAKV